MSQRGVRQYLVTRRWVLLGMVLVVLAAVALWLLLSESGPFRQEPDPLATLLDDNTAQLVDYRERIETTLRLQALAAEMNDGRRSVALRPNYRLIEDLLEPIIARQQPDERAALRAELTALLPDLTRNRGAARARIERLIEMLRSPAGPGRQGGDAI